MDLLVEGIGVLGPGLAGWETASAALSGEAGYEPLPVNLPPAVVLAAPERRRAIATVKLALAVGSEALAASGRAAHEVATVFTSSGGDGRTVHEILGTLATAERDVSPTRFHNSVHNAPSGYWTIATGARTPTTALCAHDGSFAAGLLEAASQVITERRPVLLVAYDLPYPDPLDKVRSISAPFGVGLVMSAADAGASLASLALEPSPVPGMTPDRLDDAALERLRRTNPAARSLPLLAALAGRRRTELVVDGAPAVSVRVRVTPR